MRLIHKGQRGFTLIELVLVIGLTGIIAAAITGTILGVFNMDARTRNDMIAVYQVRQAGKLVSKDIMEAWSVNAGGGSGFPLTLTWTHPETGDSHNVTYTLVDMPSSEFKRLKRSVTITPPEGEPTTTVSIVAEYIDPDPAQTSCACCDQSSCHYGICDDDEWLTFTVTATVGEQSETRVYEVKPRPGS